MHRNGKRHRNDMGRSGLGVLTSRVFLLRRVGLVVVVVVVVMVTSTIFGLYVLEILVLHC